jgi:hypothetical protein
VTRPIPTSILGRPGRRRGQGPGTVPKTSIREPRKSAPFMYPPRAAVARGERKPVPRPVAYPDRPMPQDGAQRDRWQRELVGSIVDRTCPVLLDRDEAMAALDVGPGTFDRWLREGRVGDMVAVGERQLFRAAVLREIILDRRPGGAAPARSATSQ